jgi:two-component system cell cycle sensor histidine kinase/response regulator CckA
MSQTAADREALMKAIKVALKQQLWADPRERPTFGRYLSLFILNPEPMWVYDVPTLQILDVNEAAMLRYGYSRHEFLALTIRELRPEEDVPKFLELLPSTPNSDRTGPWRHKLKDGSIIQVLITSHSVKFGDRNARLVMAESLSQNPDVDIG